jgi:hypothetical protein
LARLYGLTQKAFNREIRLSFVKVVEYQQRGVIHLHAVARFDHVAESSTLELNGQFLATAIEMAISQVSVLYPHGRGIARFGFQLDLQIMDNEESTHRRGVAGYVVKYATKSSDDDGVLDRRIRSEDDLAYRDLTRTSDDLQRRLDEWVETLN